MPVAELAAESCVLFLWGCWPMLKGAIEVMDGWRGKPKRLNADVRQGIIAPRREHSRKPDGIHERIERLVAGPYLELFARQSRPGWTTWGNEATKFDRPYDPAANSRGCYEVAIEALRKKAEGE